MVDRRIHEISRSAAMGESSLYHVGCRASPDSPLGMNPSWFVLTQLQFDRKLGLGFF